MFRCIFILGISLLFAFSIFAADTTSSRYIPSKLPNKADAVDSSRKNSPRNNGFDIYPADITGLSLEKEKRSSLALPLSVRIPLLFCRLGGGIFLLHQLIRLIADLLKKRLDQRNNTNIVFQKDQLTAQTTIMETEFLESKRDLASIKLEVDELWRVFDNVITGKISEIEKSVEAWNDLQLTRNSDTLEKRFEELEKIVTKLASTNSKNERLQKYDEELKRLQSEISELKIEIEESTKRNELQTMDKLRLFGSELKEILEAFMKKSNQVRRKK